MGSALSCIHGASVSSRHSQSQQAAAPPEPARVIAPDGTLKDLPAASGPLPSVSDVLSSGDAEAAAPSFFVCNSDALYFNEPPTALAAAERLRPGQIYFVLPAAMLGRPLTSADMAALAVGATSALGACEKPPRRRRWGRVGKKKQVRVVPILREDGADRGEEGGFYERVNEQTLGGFAVSTSPAARSSGDKAVVAVASRQTRSSALQRMLSMIGEDDERDEGAEL